MSGSTLHPGTRWRGQGNTFFLFFSSSCGQAAVYPETSWVDPFDFFSGDVTIDGESFTNVGVRKKGFFGSLSSTRPSLKVKLNHHVGGQQYNDVVRLTLSDFWDGKYKNTIEPKSAEAAADMPEIDALTVALMDNGLSGADRLTAIEAVVDVDAFITYWAAEGMVGHWDGYQDNQNNYWFYIPSSDGLIHFIPRGPDATFGAGNQTPGRAGGAHADAIVPRGALARRLYEIPSTKALYLAKLQSLMSDVFDETAIQAEIDRMEAIVSTVEPGTASAIDDVRDWGDAHGPHVQSEISSPPSGFSGQPGHFCDWL